MMPSSSSTSATNFRQRASGCILMTTTVICVCVLVVCGVMIVREYSLSKDYEPATCRVTNITNAKEQTCRYCASGEKGKLKQKGKGACHVSYFPCLQVLVAYDFDARLKSNGLLHPDSLQVNGKYSACSFDVCEKDRARNVVLIDEYAQQWKNKMKRKESFECFYNEYDHRTVIAEKKHTKSDVIHGMFWPSLGILICGAIFLRLEVQRRGLTMCGNQAQASQSAVNNGECRNGKNDACQTLLEMPEKKGGGIGEGSNKVTCTLLKESEPFSTSDSALDRLRINKDKRNASYEEVLRLGSSVSVDGLRQELLNDGGADSKASNLLAVDSSDKSRKDGGGTKTDISSTGSQGSKIMGLETPV